MLSNNSYKFAERNGIPKIMGMDNDLIDSIEEVFSFIYQAEFNG